MDQSMPRRSSLDLPETYEVASFEVPVSVFELPQRRVWRACVEDIAHWSHVRRDPLRREMGAIIPLWKPYMFNCLTKEEILVCLKYWLHHSLAENDERESQREGSQRTLEPWRTQRSET